MKDDPWATYHVWWLDITTDDLDRYEAVLAEAGDERPIQHHLQENPRILVQHLHGGHGRWVIPQKRLGSEYVPDFIIGERSSDGYVWFPVELESPRAQFFTKSGRPTRQFDSGLQQLREWRRWLSANRDYARRSRAEEGLGLTGIDDKAEGLLILGREADLTEHDREKRRQISYETRVAIHTYDWLSREARARLRELRRLSSTP